MTARARPRYPGVHIRGMPLNTAWIPATISTLPRDRQRERSRERKLSETWSAQHDNQGKDHVAWRERERLISMMFDKKMKRRDSWEMERKPPPSAITKGFGTWGRAWFRPRSVVWLEEHIPNRAQPNSWALRPVELSCFRPHISSAAPRALCSDTCSEPTHTHTLQTALAQRLQKA